MLSLWVPYTAGLGFGEDYGQRVVVVGGERGLCGHCLLGRRGMVCGRLRRRGECGCFGVEVAVGTVGVGFYGHGSHLGEMKIVDSSIVG